MARLTITEAINQSRIGRTRMYSHYIKKGIITVSVDNKGSKYIDSSELLRVFGEMNNPKTTEQVKDSVNRPLVNSPEQDKTDLLIKLLRDQLEKAESREKQHMAHIDALTLRLESPVKKHRKSSLLNWWNNLGEKD